LTDNLARKPRLTLIKAGGDASPDILAIVPDLKDEPLKSDREGLRWLTSLLIILIAYGAPLAWWFMPEKSTGANTPPPAAMVVELAPVPVAPTSQPDMPPGPEQTETTPPPKPELLPEPEPEPEIPPAPPEVKPEVAVKPKPEPVTEERPVPKEPPPPEAPEDLPPEDQPSSMASAPPDAAQEDLEAAAPEQGVVVPAFNATAIPTWQNSLMLKLNEAKRYPTRARRYRQEGVAYLRFTMDREGNVLAKSIEQSAGHSLLDEETLELIDRAQPLPEPPTEMQGEILEFVVPVEFFLNR